MAEIFTIESGALPAGTRVAAFTGRERLSTPFRYDLWLLVPGADAPDLDAATVVFQPATLFINTADGTPRARTDGLVAALELVVEQPGGDALYRATLVPTLWKLGLTRHSRVWVDTTIPDVLADVFRKGGIPDARVANRLRGRYAARPHVCQYRESDLAFVSRWMEREGITYFFEHGDDGDVLVLVDDKTAHAPGPDAPVRYVPEDADGTGGNEGLRSWGNVHRARSARVELADYDPLRPTSPVNGAASAASEGWDVVFRHHEDNFQDASEGRRLATVRAEERLAERSTYKGEGRVFDVRPGFTFDVEDHPRAGFNREYLAVEVVHQGRLIAGDDALSRWVPSLGRRTHWAALTAVPSDVQYRPPMATPLPRVAGVEVGHVDGPADSEYAQLDEHGRYLIRLHFDENDNPDGAASTRVRMLQPHAGAPEGWHFPLRKDTEVMVIFQGGDPDRPLIAAAVPNPETVSPVTEPNHTQNVAHTGSDNRIEVEDSAGGQYIDMYSPPQRSFIHLGAHHGSHRYNYITSTDGNGLIHTGGVLNVTVGGEKFEHVHGSVLEEYDKTQSTEVTGAVDEKYHVDLHTTVDFHCQENYNATQTTVVEGHVIETCQDQETHVRGHLNEHHGTQTMDCETEWKVDCASELFSTGASTQTIGTLTWNVHAGGALIRADTFTMTGPSFDQNVRTVRTVTRPNEVRIDVGKDEYTPFKFEAAIMSLKLNGLAATNLAAKVDILTGQAVEAFGAKIETSGVKLSLGSLAMEYYATTTEMSGVRVFLLGLLVLI